MNLPWPYNLPIYRGSHRASSPDGKQVAEIETATEVSMGNPTRGTLTLGTGLEIVRCNPSFLWSDDSRYLAVPQYFARLGLFRRQRMVVVDTLERSIFASKKTAFYYQPESFSDGLLEATKEPFHKARRVSWRIPEELAEFKSVNTVWTEPAP